MGCGCYNALLMENAGMKHGMAQSMVASASMQMFMRVLQCSTMGLEQLVRQAMAANPVLEEEPPPSQLSAGEGDWEQGVAADAEAGRRHDFVLDSLYESPSLHEHLKEQVRRSGIEPELEHAALLLIDELDARGFFEEDPRKAAGRLGLSGELLRRALEVVHDLEPAGVGARDLRESLSIQLAQAGEKDSLAARLLDACWEDLVRHRYEAAAKMLGVREEEVREAAWRIARLNPDPGAPFAREERATVAPDLFVRPGRGGEMEVELAEGNLPRLRIDATYQEMLAERADDREVRSYLSRCFREGRELMKAIADRRATILAVGRAIVARQREFFLKGPEGLQPLRMEDVARDAGVHVSTVSRAVNNKYLLCSWGLFELRSFFQSALQTSKGEGKGGDGAQGMAAGAVQARIRALIDAENTAKPLSDARIESLLAEEGITVARRTIAKYREQMKILPASLRKR